MSNVWSKERAWEWYNSHTWLRGCNYMSADCANRMDQWQEYGFEERLNTADQELALAASIGFNTIRIIPEFYVWYKQHDGFMERFERYIAMAWKHGISCMVVFGNDCMPPKEEALKRFYLGEQHYDIGYHGGRKVSQHQNHGEKVVGYHLLDEPELALAHYEWVREIMTKYKDDERIVMWDMYNEPGNSNRSAEYTLPHLKKFFEIARVIDPIQPLTCGIWKSTRVRVPEMTELERFAAENSDIISFHNYGNYDDMVRVIRLLKELGRPIVNTEWLNRCGGNSVQAIYPLFFLEKIGCYCWGFVAGKYQTFEPWNSVWQQYEENPKMDFDFTKWLHDLYRPSLHPYDPREVDLIKDYNRLADEDFVYHQSK